jgi:hypothetical protein
MSWSPGELPENNGEIIQVDNIAAIAAGSFVGSPRDIGDILSINTEDTPAIGELQSFTENDSCLQPNEKTHYGISLCFAYFKDFSMDVPPY